MHLADIPRRLVIFVAAAICLAWLRSPVRRFFREAMRNRTVMLMEQCDEDARALRELRDMTIPLAFRALAEEKAALIEQLARLSDGEIAPVSSPLPDPAPRIRAGTHNQPA